MYPQACDLWPSEVGPLFSEICKCFDAQDSAGALRRCRRVESILKRIETDAPKRPLRLQVARAHLELSFFYRRLDKVQTAKRALERSRDRWRAAVKTSRGDFYAWAQLGACCNHLGLMAQDDGDYDAAEEHYFDALDARESANNRYLEIHPEFDEDDDDYFCDNRTYYAGVLCNLAHVFRLQGDSDDDATTYYDDAIQELKKLVHVHPKKEDREHCEFCASTWETIHDQPHYTRVSKQFLENARSGRAELKKKKRK